jgi:hypothetical protein
MIQFELDVYRDHRWWTIEELYATSELIFPLDLADLLVGVTSGDALMEPVHLLE